MLKKSQKGFSLLELLVVVVIIGIIAMLVIAFMSGARQRGRDARRDRDTHEIRTALGIYATDHNGRFPNDLSELEPIYIPILPVDPLNQGTNTYQYTPGVGNNSYVLTYCYEYSAPECKQITP